MTKRDGGEWEVERKHGGREEKYEFFRQEITATKRQI